MCLVRKLRRFALIFICNVQGLRKESIMLPTQAPLQSDLFFGMLSVKLVSYESVVHSREGQPGCLFIHFKDDNCVLRFLNGTDYRPSAGTVCMIPAKNAFVISNMLQNSLSCILCNGTLLDTFLKSCNVNREPKLTLRPGAIDEFNAAERILLSDNCSEIEEANRCAAHIYMLIVETAFATIHTVERKPAIIAQKIKTYIDENLHEEITVSSIARHFYLSETHVIRIFRDKYGETPKQYMLKRKMEASKKMLIDTTLQIKEIAMIFHFADSYHFSHTFKRFTGFSPEKFRMREANNPETNNTQ